MNPARVPDSTYRLQFNARFTFRHAAEIVDYLRALGIGDCYASSYLAAVPGSLHGYDVADPTRLNPEVGTNDDYWSWIDKLRAHQMGHVLDVVPNHMGIAKSANPWWCDVLENGPSSRFARFFDIEWHPIKDELADKVLIPILGDQYGAVLERQELELTFRDGAFFLKYYDETIPIAPDTYPDILGRRLDEWRRDQATTSDGDELDIILTAARNLPSRSSRDRDAIDLRAREKEVVKRRLAALAAGSGPVRRLIEESITHFRGTPGDARSFDPLDRLLNQQSYRLAHWRVASEEINYRRFFDVNQLAALRMEDPEVFEAVHRFVFDLVGRGATTGLRIDHVDGLFDPGAYLQRLQERCGPAGTFIVVEKILARGEQLPRDWPVAGTTGYEFAATVNNLFVDRRNERALDDVYARFLRNPRGRLSFDELAYRTKKEILHQTMSGDINSLGHQLNRFSERNRHYRDFTLYSLISTIKEVIASFPVYRTYVTESQPVSEHDRRYVRDAVRAAKRRAPGLTSVVYDFIERLLLKETATVTREECEDRARFIGKFQQITGPVAAKGIEDTALYIHNRLVSLNEVGGDPTAFGLEPSAVHEWMRQRQAQWPHALSATATHDTKRGEDVRARINVISEIPGAWKAAVMKWRTLNRRLKVEIGDLAAPDANEEYLLYQTLVGAWPFHGNADEGFRSRVREYMVKAMREAKVHTSWLSPNEEYEAAVGRFITAILEGRRAQPFLQAFLPFQARVAEHGIYNSLAQLVIKIAAPGVPDFYQGTELWDLNLVDPDNRRPVDYAARRDALQSICCAQTRDEAALAADLLAHRADGRIKMFTMTRALAARRSAPELFTGEYLPIETAGRFHDSIFAFARRHGADWAMACVPRLTASVVPDAATPPVGAVWADTVVRVPEAARGVRFRDALSGRRFDATTELPVHALFEGLPVALLISRR